MCLAEDLQRGVPIAGDLDRGGRGLQEGEVGGQDQEGSQMDQALLELVQGRHGHRSEGGEEEDPAAREVDDAAADGVQARNNQLCSELQELLDEVR